MMNIIFLLNLQGQLCGTHFLKIFEGLFKDSKQIGNLFYIFGPRNAKDTVPKETVLPLCDLNSLLFLKL